MEHAKRIEVISKILLEYHPRVELRYYAWIDRSLELLDLFLDVLTIQWIYIYL